MVFQFHLWFNVPSSLFCNEPWRREANAKKMPGSANPRLESMYTSHMFLCHTKLENNFFFKKLNLTISPTPHQMVIRTRAMRVNQGPLK
uniref:Uncharacterized protein n=1 Tax=Arundo donax TaxID=35708 RepID=A0A0A9DUA8_ARUDO